MLGTHDCELKKWTIVHVVGRHAAEQAVVGCGGVGHDGASIPVNVPKADKCLF